MPYHRKARRYRAKRAYKKPTLKAVKTIVKRAMATNTETKLASWTIRGNSFLDSTIYTMCPLQLISEGVDNNQRVGRKVHFRYLTLSGYHFGGQVSGVYRPTVFRIIGMWSTGTKMNPGTSLTYNTGSVISGFTDTEVFIPGQNVTSSLVDARLGHQVVFDRKITINPYSNVDMVKPFKFSIKLNRDCQYLFSAPPSLFAGKNFYILVMADVVGQATGVLASPIQELNLAVTYTDI